MNKFYFIDNQLKLAGKFDTEKLEEIFDYESHMIGNIYRGRIESRNDNLGASFVNIGEGESGYLSYEDGGNLHENTEVLVQVKKTATGKGPRLTREISVGNDVVRIFPNKHFKKFSRKLSQDEICHILANTLEIVKQYPQGVLFRTKAKDLNREELVEILQYYYPLAENLELEINRRPTPKLLYTEHPLKDYYRRSDKSLPWIVNLETRLPFLQREVLYDSTFSLRFHPKLLFDYKSLFEKHIKLEGGASIVIEKTEAAIMVDVNSSSEEQGQNFEEMAFHVNCIALEEIMRQIRLRNLSGIILIDFLKMNLECHKRELEKRMGKEFLKDKSTINLYGFTGLGLMELSRKNIGFSLQNKLESKK